MEPEQDASSAPLIGNSKFAAAGWKEIAVLLFCVSIPCCFSYALRQAAPGEIQMFDFGELYYGARCAMHHLDPYNTSSMLREFELDGGHFARLAPGERESVNQIVITRTVNLPTGLLFAVPFAILPWGVAQVVWMILTAALLATAAYLIWDLGAGAAPLLWLSLAGFMLAESDLLFKVGNLAGISVSLCIIAVWCFIRQRCIFAGILLLAISLVLKPHDSGFVWLYFLVAGGRLRKRALQTLALTAVLAASAALWIQPASPRWLSELHRNVDFEVARGSVDDPGPSGMGAGTAAAIIDLQSILSGVKDDPHFYNPLAYTIAGLPLLILFLVAFRKRPTQDGMLLALAAISALSLLPVYHRINDAGILLLSLPACVLLWNERRPGRSLALVLTSAAILFTASTPLAFLSTNSQAISAVTGKVPGWNATLIAFHATPFILLVMGCFYVWLYLRNQPVRGKPVAGIATASATLAG
jgi:hypothetical protein